MATTTSPALRPLWSLSRQSQAAAFATWIVAQALLSRGSFQKTILFAKRLR